MMTRFLVTGLMAASVTLLSGCASLIGSMAADTLTASILNQRDPSMVELTFVEGGRLLERNTFRRLMSLDTQAEARARLAWELRATGIGHVFRPDTGELSELETALLRAEINQQNEAMRADPNGPAPILSYALELRAEVRNLTGIIWGVALRAPSALIQANMVVP